MALEMQGKWKEAATVYDHLLDRSPTNAPILKRKVAMERSQGNLKAAVELLNQYLATYVQVFPSPNILAGNKATTAHFLAKCAGSIRMEIKGCIPLESAIRDLLLSFVRGVFCDVLEIVVGLCWHGIPPIPF